MAAQEEKELSKKLEDVKIDGGESQENGHESSDEDVEDGNTEEVKGKAIYNKHYDPLVQCILCLLTIRRFKKEKEKEEVE